MKEIIRFPRTGISKGTLNRFESILRITWNKIGRQQSLGKSRFRYDIYKTKRGDEARLVFLRTACTLDSEDIDPALYLKVLAKYFQGRPISLQWIAKEKALETFHWILKKERKKFLMNREFKNHLNDFENLTDLRIEAEVGNSADVVCSTAKTFSFTIGEAALINAEALSPWYLAICTPFLSISGLERISSGKKDEVIKCIKHLCWSRKAFGAAFKTFTRAHKRNYFEN